MEGLCLEREGFPPRRPPEQLEVPSPEQRQNGTLTLRFAPSAAWRVRDYFAPGQIRAGEDGCLLVECDFPQDGWLLGFLLSFGDQVEVFAPASWREVLGRTGKKIAALYETGHSVSGIQAYPEGTEEGSTPPEQKEEPDMEGADLLPVLRHAPGCPRGHGEQRRRKPQPGLLPLVLSEGRIHRAGGHSGGHDRL